MIKYPGVFVAFCIGIALLIVTMMIIKLKEVDAWRAQCHISCLKIGYPDYKKVISKPADRCFCYNDRTAVEMNMKTQ